MKKRVREMEDAELLVELDLLNEQLDNAATEEDAYRALVELIHVRDEVIRRTFLNSRYCATIAERSQG